MVAWRAGLTAGKCLGGLLGVTLVQDCQLDDSFLSFQGDKDSEGLAWALGMNGLSAGLSCSGPEGGTGLRKRGYCLGKPPAFISKLLEVW